MEEILFSFEFPNFVLHSYQFEPLRKNENAQNKIAKNVYPDLKFKLEQPYEKLYFYSFLSKRILILFYNIHWDKP